jgi:hypothetical protein
MRDRRKNRAGEVRQWRLPDPEAIEAALARGRAALDGIGGFESAEVIRADRDEAGGMMAAASGNRE